MLRLEANRGVRFCDGLTRRDFMRVGGLSLGLGLNELTHMQKASAAPASAKACIQIFLVGGPSQLDTWDLKPEAPARIRGPFQPIRTNVPGIHVCEHFPRMARLADRFAILRSVHHAEAPIHETGHQLMQTGYLFQRGVEHPHYGAVLSALQPSREGVPSWAVVPGPIQNTGVHISHGQAAGYLGSKHDPLFCAPEFRVAADLTAGDLFAEVDGAQRRIEQLGITAPDQLFRAKPAFDLDAEPEATRDRYGRGTFGQSCLLARRLVEHGVKLVTVNMFDTVFGQVTWDCHANGGDLNSTLDDYKDTLCPMLDCAYAALLDDLTERGLLDSTLVLCMGEFGRTPKVNGYNGRDHWPGVWSALMAGGGVRGGRVVGASDGHAAEPKERPIHPAEIAATVYRSLGIDPKTRFTDAQGHLHPLTGAEPIGELF